MKTRAVAVSAFVLSLIILFSIPACTQQADGSSYLAPADTRIIDLAVFRWIYSQSAIKADTPLLLLRLGQAATAKPASKTRDWAMVTFALDGTPPKLVTPDPSDTRVPKLIELKSGILSALQFRESYPVEAVAKLKTIQETAGELGLVVSQAMLLKLLGDLYLYDMSRYNESIDCYSRASMVFDQSRETGAISAMLYDDLAFLKSEQGKYDEARGNYAKAALLWQALALENPGNLNYRLMSGKEYLQAGEAQRAAGNPDAALDLKNQGLEDIRKYAYGVHSPSSFGALIQPLMDTAELMVERGDVERANKLMEEARNLSDRFDDNLLLARLYQTSAQVFESTGDKNQAATYAKKRVQTLQMTAERVGEPAIYKLNFGTPIKQAAKRRLIESAVMGAKAYQSLKDTKAALVMWERIAAYYAKNNNQAERVLALRAISSIYTDMQDPEHAKSTLEQAVSVAESSGRNALALDVLQEYVSYLENNGNTDDAVKAYFRLISTAESGGNIRTGAAARVGRGKLLAGAGRYDEAAKDFQYAYQKYMNQIGDLWASIEVTIDLADVLTKAGRGEEVVSVLESAVSESSAGYASAGAESEIARNRQNLMVSLCGRLVRIYTGSNQITQAEALLRKFAGRPWLPSLLRELSDDPDKKIVEFVSKYTSTPGPDDSNTQNNTQNMLAQDAASFASVCWNLEDTRRTEYNSLPMNPMSVLALRHTMPKDAVFIEYMPTDTSLYIFAIGQKHTVCIEMSETGRDISDAYRNLRRVLKKCEESLSSGVPVAPVVDRSEPSFLEIRAPLSKLYEILIDPVIGLIPQDSLLIFALPGQLSGMPMHSLMSTDPQGKPVFLCESYYVTYIDSSGVRSLDSSQEKPMVPGTSKLVVFADPNGELPGARKESEIIANAFAGGRTLVGSQATTDAFYNEITSADIVHIAAHHAISSDKSQQILKLAPGNSGDGSILLSDLLAKQPLHPRLVFLSTCDSLFATDMLSASLNRTGEAFLLAGVSSVVGGLWKISDDAESGLAGEFYKGLAVGEFFYQAIRRAQLSMIKSTGGRFTHPYYWAALALYGSPG